MKDVGFPFLLMENQEKKELEILLDRGVKFEVTEIVTQRRGLFRRQRVPVRRSFVIKEPTLAVMDRMSLEWTQIKIDEGALTKGDNNTLQEARKVVTEQSHRMAVIVALAVLGEDYFTIDTRGHRGTDEKELQRLASLFMHTIKPSKLAELSTIITNCSNLSDFIASTRLMSANRTTDPRINRVEKEED